MQQREQEEKDNISTIFLLPGIQVKENVKKRFHQNGFVNTYLTCDQLKYPYEVIYLLFQPRELGINFLQFSNELQENPNFIEIIDLGLNRVLFVYRVPAKFRRDYHLFMEGKYSQLSNEYKRCFAMEDYKRDANSNPVRIDGRMVKEPTLFFHIFNRTDYIKERWRLKIFDENEQIDKDLFENIELYDRQNEEREAFDVGFQLI